ncbi:OsmC family protein [Campylobacter sp.]|uniref:OsmC family protein n=1 Tax=Campylobacter sp. TaxID=205 RepID=UPI003FA119D6
MNIKVISESKLRNKINFDGKEIFTDAPGPFGLGENLSPAEMLAAAFASCAMTIMAIRVAECGENFVGCYTEVEKEVDMNDFRITKIVLNFHLKSEFSPSTRAVIKEAFDKQCIVGRSLNPSIEQEVKFIYE